jgi:hypothetical protein
MKLRSLFLFGAGIAVGLTVARKLAEDDADIARGPQRAAAQTSLSGRATVLSLDAIRKARGAIRQRLDTSGYDDVAWS